MDHDDMQSWTSQEDDRLREALILNKKGTKNWREVAAHVGTKTAHQCQQRWKNTLNPDVLRIKGRWTTEEDTRLAELVKRHGTKNWRYIASHLRGRLPKQCRERWCNQLDPHIKKDGLTSDEWVVVKRAHEIYGNRWAEIAKQVPGRTANHIKNQWNTMLRRASADAESDGSASDDISEELSSSTTATASGHSLSSSRKRKPSARFLSADEDLSFFDAAPLLKRGKYVEDDEDSMSETDTNSCETSNPLLSVVENTKRATTTGKSSGDFSAFSALVDASCEVLQQQQSPPSPTQQPIPLVIVHPGLYNGANATVPWSDLTKQTSPLPFVPGFAY